MTREFDARRRLSPKHAEATFREDAPAENGSNEIFNGPPAS